MFNRRFIKGVLSVLLFVLTFFYEFSVQGITAENKHADSFFPYSVTLKLINEISLPGNPVDVFLKEGYAYIICSTLGIANISDPMNIPPVKYFNDLPDSPLSIAFNGSYAFIALNNGTIYILDIKNTEIPKYEGNIDAFGTIVKVMVSNGYLYSIKKDFGLQVYDVSTPNFPILKGGQIVTGEANGLFIKNNLAYITSLSATMSIIDISNLSTLPVVGNYNSGINFYDVFVNDNYAYIPQGETGVQVINISKLPTPEHITNIFSRRFSKQVVISGYYTWVNDQNTIQAFYNYDPTKQLYAGSFDNLGSNINKIQILDNKYIFLCSDNNKLRVIQIIYNY
jgi:hypothetical protein